MILEPAERGIQALGPRRFEKAAEAFDRIKLRTLRWQHS
jgi:hypothetical protein